MLIGEHLRAIRESKKLSQGDIEKRAGLLRSYISRVECGHTVPAMETLEKFARALEVPLYKLFYDLEEVPRIQGASVPRRKRSAKEEAFDRRMVRLLARIDERDRKLLLDTARKMAKR